MKAITYNQYGGPEVLQITELPKPTPKPDEVLVKIKATSVNYGDLIARNFGNISPEEFNMPGLLWRMARIGFGIKQPKVQILGSEFSGIIEAVGEKISRFKIGDKVFGYSGQSMGAYAEYTCMKENSAITQLPSTLTFEEAAVVPYGAVMAINLIKRANITPKQKVLINGASGSIGSMALQLAKYYGAEVTAVCSTSKTEMMHKIGADHVIDYKKSDFTLNGEKYDLIFDVLGRAKFENVRNSLTPSGTIQYASFKGKKLRQMIWTSVFGRQKVKCTVASGSLTDFREVAKIFESGKLVPPLGKVFPMEEISEAHSYVESGENRGKVAISIL